MTMYMEFLKFYSFDDDREYDEDYVKAWVDRYYPQYWDIGDVMEDIGGSEEALFELYREEYYPQETLDRVYRAIQRTGYFIFKYYYKH